MFIEVHVFYITNEMQLIQCSFIIISALHVSGGFSVHHQELIKLYVQPWVHIQFYKLLMMSGKPPETCRALIIINEHCISCISLVI